MEYIKKVLKKKWSKAGFFTLIAVLFSAFVFLVGMFENLELKSLDLRFKARGNLPTEDSDIIIVTIDDQTFTALQKNWPFPRSYFAKAIQNLSEAGAKLIVIDVTFTEPSAVNAEEDNILAQSISQANNVILAGKIAIEYGTHNTLNKYILKPIKPLLEAGARWGYANIGHDPDGFIRRYTLFQPNENFAYLPLAVETYRNLYNISPADIKLDVKGGFKIGKKIIPKYDYNSMMINYYGPANNFPVYSFANILDDSDFDLAEDEDTDIFEIHKESGTFQNKIVMIGASAEDLRDNKFTPFFSYKGEKKQMPGVEMHANALNTILRDDYIHPLNSLIEFIIVVLLSVLAMVLSKSRKAYQGLIAGVIVLGVFTVFTFLLFTKMNIWSLYVFPAATFILCYGFNTVHQILTEQQEKGFYRKTFQQYVARSVVDTMLNTGELPKFGGERKRLTVLFSDIRSFTTFSEKYSPEIVVQRLTEYLSAMVDIIFRHDGTLDKFVGDEIMAVYGAPYYFENHAERACYTALDMVAELRHIQKKWSDNRLEYFQIGIGINTGNVIVGNLGSIQLFDYTVIGDEVNLGARLEGANKQYSTTIIISESTYQDVKGKALVRELDLVRVKGRNKPVRIFELRGMYNLPSIEKDLIIDIYSYGYELFQKRKWYHALKQFRRVLRYFPSDGPARIYTQRCLNFIENPPPESWDGVIDFATK